VCYGDGGGHTYLLVCKETLVESKKEKKGKRTGLKTQTRLEPLPLSRLLPLPFPSIPIAIVVFCKYIVIKI
jgi:hypothetical protein